MSALADFHFLRPLWLLLILAVPLFWLLRRHGRADAGAWRNAIDAHLLPHLIERIDAGSGRAGVVLAVALWTIACMSLAGRHGNANRCRSIATRPRACSRSSSARR